ncbi:MAG: hypothetical protein HDR88_16705 [Bacteroides sp.]|nr:hypothetical protein [Bacteroides sp.]
MTKKLSLLLWLLIGGKAVTLSASSTVLTPDQALCRVKTGMQKAPYGRFNDATPQLVFTGMTVSDEPAVYVFAASGEGGYMILSADDIAVPMLGYSDEGNFDSTNIPPQLEWWLQEYAREIEHARRSEITSPGEYKAPDDRIAIEPMVKTKWNQDAPYYDLCPEKKNKHCYTGCAATAMAQVMNYFQYPEMGEGKASYTCSGFGNLSLNLEEKPFDWANMLDTYTAGSYSAEQGDAVAYLMQACGYSIKMAYSPDGSGALSANIPVALKKYFKYDGNVRYERRMLYSSAEWDEMIYKNLKNVGPIVYDGASPLGGHSFVCDGYDGNGYFHFNWGWSGQGDGYFMLNALNPTFQGIGGFAGGFNTYQDAILGIQKPTGEPVEPEDYRLLQYGALHAEAKGYDISMLFTDWNPVGYESLGTEKFRCEMGGIIEPTDATSGETIYEPLSSDNVLSIIPTNFYQVREQFPLVIHFPEETVNGTYKVTLATKVANDDDAQWLPTVPPYGYPNYFYVDKSDDGITIRNVEIPQLNIESLSAITECHYGYMMQFSVTISNPTELELTQAVCPVLMKNGEMIFIGDSKLFSIAPGETLTEDWTMSLNQVSTASIPGVGKTEEFTLSAYNPDTNNFYGEFGTVEMIRLAEKNNFQSRGLSIQNATSQREEGDTVVYMIEDSDNILVEQSVEVVAGYFGYPILTRIYAEDESKPGTWSMLSEQTLGEVSFISSGETKAVTGSITYPEAEEGKTYQLRTLYMSGTLPSKLDQVNFKYTTAGIHSICEGNDMQLLVDHLGGRLSVECVYGIADVKVYRIDGTELRGVLAIGHNSAEIGFGHNVGGMILVRVTDGRGIARTYKVTL